MQFLFISILPGIYDFYFTHGYCINEQNKIYKTPINDYKWFIQQSK